MIALHVVLVYAIVLQVDEDAIYEAYPEGGGSEVGGEGAEREFVAFRRVDDELEGLHGSLWHGEHQDSKAQDGSTYKNDALNGISPDDGLQSSQHGIDDDTYGCGYDYQMYVPPHQYIHRHSKEVKDATHSGYLCKQITGRGI